VKHKHIDLSLALLEAPRKKLRREGRAGARVAIASRHHVREVTAQMTR
jgi:hypothetical protein